ncbi:MAG: hypothetical protein ABI148_04905 [Ginsengibacter sp.]
MNSTIYIAISILVFLILFSMAISYINQKKKKREQKKLLKEFENFAIKNHLSIDKKQELRQSMIGIDRLNLRFVFLNNRTIPASFHVIKLKDISTCRLIKQKNLPTGHISHIFLKFTFKQKSLPDINISFYDALHDDIFKMMRLSKEASYWEKRVNIFRQTAVLSEQNV